MHAPHQIYAACDWIVRKNCIGGQNFRNVEKNLRFPQIRLWEKKQINKKKNRSKS